MLQRKLLQVAAATAFVALATGAAHADFIIDPSPGGVMFFNGDANKDVASFVGTVGGQHSGPAVTVDTVGNVDTGAGFSTIKPVQDGSLTSLTFTPADGNLFADFSFRGQLLSDADGTVEVTVQDNQGGAPQTFTFTDLGAEADFARIGIVAVAGSEETIQSVTLTSDFKEQKQNEFSFAPGVVPEPGALALLAGLGGPLCLGLMRGRWRR